MGRLRCGVRVSAIGNARPVSSAGKWMGNDLYEDANSLVPRDFPGFVRPLRGGGGDDFADAAGDDIGKVGFAFFAEEGAVV